MISIAVRLFCSFKINQWLNSKRTDGVPLVEIQVRKPIKCKRGRRYSESERNVLITIASRPSKCEATSTGDIATGIEDLDGTHGTKRSVH